FFVILTSERTRSFLNLPALRFLGRISYGVYTIHFLVLGSISSWLFLRLLDHITYGATFLLVLGSGLIASLLLAYAATVTIDAWSIAAASHAGIAAKATLARVQRLWTRGMAV